MNRHEAYRQPLAAVLDFLIPAHDRQEKARDEQKKWLRNEES
jgi:hypothetical protein